MNHFEMGDWVDYVRGLANGGDRTAMEQHLSAGCTECNATVRFLSQVAEAADLDQLYETGSEPLKDAVVRAFRNGNPLRRVARELRALVATLVYDSMLDLRPAEARSAGPAARHLMYEAGQYLVDIRVDSQAMGPGVTATGQIMDRRSPESPLADLPVTLVDDGGAVVVASTVCNEFGEFVVEYTPHAGLRLQFAVVSAGDQVEIELQPLDEESNDDEITD